MLTQTSELAVRALIYLGLNANDQPTSPRQIAQNLGCSRSYLVKTLGLLVKSGLLRSQRGAHGGVILVQPPADITLLDIIEACQGLLVGNYCQELEEASEPVCAFHQAMKEIHLMTLHVLSKWSLADMIAGYTPVRRATSQIRCKMVFEGCERFSPDFEGKAK